MKTSVGMAEYHLTDALGSVRQLTDPGGSVLLSRTFDPYGSLYEQSRGGVLWDATSPHGWTGQQSDPNGLTYLRARYYNPSMGRFTQIDPFAGALALPSSLNGYAYGHGNPTRYTDPEGLCGPLCWIAIAAIGATLLGGGAYAYQVHNNIQSGMDPWQAMYYENINWPLVGGAAVAGAILAPAAYACFVTGGWCLALLSNPIYQKIDQIDDAATPYAASQGDEEAQSQVMALAALGWVPDLPINFALAKADDVIDLVRHADDVGEAGSAARHVLVVGESNEVVGESEAFEYARNLARARPNWQVAGTQYGNGLNTQDLLDPPADIPNLTLYNNVDATRLGEGAIGARGRIVDDIVFHGPERQAMTIGGVRISWERSSGNLAKEVIMGADDVLRPGGSVRFTSAGGMPAVKRLDHLVIQANWPEGYIGSRVPWNQGGDFAVPFVSRRSNAQRLDQFENSDLFWYIFMLSQ